MTYGRRLTGEAAAGPVREGRAAGARGGRTEGVRG
ncbi:hypothetical protein FHS22_001823 [Planomonospora venezuelensis]|uniref:Uncharacterized protein n=1 Tax=Planomonospora venezuelensis TaxID=1999 RepID=A0A841CVZ6_PLAVE|nr:hypothetical protein [Planomonospora venezuelensis]